VGEAGSTIHLNNPLWFIILSHTRIFGKRVFLMPKYRCRFEIIADILSCAASGAARRTRIMYSANLSHSLLKKYLSETVSLGFIKPNNNGEYEITEKGLAYLRKYKCFVDKYSKVQRDLKIIMSEIEELEDMCALPAKKDKARGSARTIRREMSLKI